MNSTLTDKEINKIEIKQIKNEIYNILTGMLIGFLIILLITFIGIFI